MKEAGTEKLGGHTASWAASSGNSSDSCTQLCHMTRAVPGATAAGMTCRNLQGLLLRAGSVQLLGGGTRVLTDSSQLQIMAHIGILFPRLSHHFLRLPFHSAPPHYPITCLSATCPGCKETSRQELSHSLLVAGSWTLSRPPHLSEPFGVESEGVSSSGPRLALRPRC